jgi:hypothetical protein
VLNTDAATGAAIQSKRRKVGQSHSWVTHVVRRVVMMEEYQMAGGQGRCSK